MTIIKTMTIVRAPGSNHKPMIRIANDWLRKYGFTVGDKFTVEYSNGELIIRKI